MYLYMCVRVCVCVCAPGGGALCGCVLCVCVRQGERSGCVLFCARPPQSRQGRVRMYLVRVTLRVGREQNKKYLVNRTRIPPASQQTQWHPAGKQAYIAGISS